MDKPEQTFVSLEVATLAKRVGFNKALLSFYKNGQLIIEVAPFGPYRNEELHDEISAPTYWLLSMWLRNDKNVIVSPYDSNEDDYITELKKLLK